jgi:hypothetical protein
MHHPMASSQGLMHNQLHRETWKARRPQKDLNNVANMYLVNVTVKILNRTERKNTSFQNFSICAQKNSFFLVQNVKFWSDNSKKI